MFDKTNRSEQQPGCKRTAQAGIAAAAFYTLSNNQRLEEDPNETESNDLIPADNHDHINAQESLLSNVRLSPRFPDSCLFIPSDCSCFICTAAGDDLYHAVQGNFTWYFYLIESEACRVRDFISPHSCVSKWLYGFFVKIAVAVAVPICTVCKASTKHLLVCLHHENTKSTKQKQNCTRALAWLYLQSDVSPGQTTSPAEADLHVVKSTVSLGDISHLNVTTTLRLGLACWRGSDRKWE